jgi:4-carboxymuconolactone decarboxylase
MTPRLTPTTADERDDETNALVESVGGLNIFTTLARHPKALKRWLVFGGHVLSRSTLPARERELLILRVGWRCGSEYEFGQHALIGGAVGLDPTEIRRLTVPELDGWSDADALVVRAADELVADHCIGDETWAGLAARWGDQELIDLLFTVGQYVLVSMTLNSLGVERDAGVPGWPT